MSENGSETVIKDGFYNEDQQELLYWLTLTFSILSILGQSMIFCTYICLKLESPISARVEKDKARSIHIFIVFISFYDLMRIIGTLINADYPYSDDINACIAESVLIAFGALASFQLVGLISIIMVISVFLESKAEHIIGNIHKLRWILIIIITILSLCGGLIPINFWCIDDYHKYLRGIYFLPLLIIFGIIICSYICIWISFCCKKSIEVNNDFYKDIHTFPGVLIGCWIFSVYRRIYNVVNDKEPQFAVSCIAVITVSLYGFCNFVCYWWTLKRQYDKLREEEEEEDNSMNNDRNQNEMQAISQHDDSD